MDLTVKDIAQMMDLSCVRTYSTRQDILELVEYAKLLQAGQVSVLQCFIPLTKELLGKTTGIRVVGNVSFPSGSDSTSLKVAQANEMLASGCEEIDMVMNVGRLRSGETDEVTRDVEAVRKVVKKRTLKVIIEVMYLNPLEVQQACEICVKTGADFVKTGTGWAEKGTTVEDVRLIKAIVGDRIKIKASGGIRDLSTLLAMYKSGARRFGVNLKSGRAILETCQVLGGKVSLD